MTRITAALHLVFLGVVWLAMLVIVPPWLILSSLARLVARPVRMRLKRASRDGV